jgi:hypothetical protein
MRAKALRRLYGFETVVLSDIIQSIEQDAEFADIEATR